MVCTKDNYGKNVVNIKNYKFSMHGFIRQNYDVVLNEAIPYNWDALFIVFGREGCGKTTFASQGALYLQHNFNIDHTVFIPNQFEKCIDYCKDESSILWDEAITGANVSQHASEVSQSIISKLTQIRKKKLKIFLCFPYLNMLNKYFISRCIGGFYIYAKSFTDRGYGIFYDANKMTTLYGIMKEKYRYNYMGAIKEVRGLPFNFTKCLCLNEKIYDDKKEIARKEYQMVKGNIWKKRIVILLKKYTDVMPIAKVAKLWGVNKSGIYQMLRETEV